VGVQRSSGATQGARDSELQETCSPGFPGQPLAPVRGLGAASCGCATKAIIQALFLFTPLHLPVPSVSVGSHIAQMSNVGASMA
jgi:hypothetical protein